MKCSWTASANGIYPIGSGGLMGIAPALGLTLRIAIPVAGSTRITIGYSTSPAQGHLFWRGWRNSSRLQHMAG